MKKDVTFEWDNQAKTHWKNSNHISQDLWFQLTHIVDCALDQSLQALLAQVNIKNKENALYNMSPTLVGLEQT